MSTKDDIDLKNKKLLQRLEQQWNIQDKQLQ